MAVVLPSFTKIDEKTSYPFQSKLSLGLDLQGGLYMVLGIDFNEVYRDEVRSMGRRLLEVLKDGDVIAELGDLDASDPQDPKLTLMLSQPSQLSSAKAKIKEYGLNAIRLTGEGGANLQYGLLSTYKTTMTQQAVGKSIEVIRNRIDEFGVTEPEIVALGKDRIVVQLPGVKDIERAKSLIGTTAKLEFKLVNDEVEATAVQTWLSKAEEKGITFEKGESFLSYLEELNQFLKGDLPKGWVLAFEKITNSKGELIDKVPFVVEETSLLTGEELQDASTQIDPQKNEPYVSMNFKSNGREFLRILLGPTWARGWR